jgi:hypothetical protein
MRTLVTTLAVLAMFTAGPASARIAGGGNSASDCYVEWENVDQTGTQGQAALLECNDGDPNCDVDGQKDGTCTFNVGSCILQRDIEGCTPPAPLKKLTYSKNLLKVKGPVTVAMVPPDATSQTQTCGTAGTIKLALKKGGTKPSKPFAVVANAISTASGALKKDKDKLKLRCLPPTPGCPENSAGGPNEFKFIIQQEATDLDNGWTGASHNQPMVFGTPLRMCLQGCDATGSTPCLQGDGTATVNGQTFGGPLPLIASQVKVCVVNKFDPARKVENGSINFATGEMSMKLNLLSEVHLGELCPNCSGNTIGASGTCQGGTNRGAACVTDGIITVPGQGTFTVSASCPPAATNAGTLTIPLNMTTGTTRGDPPLNGSKPCPGQAQDHGCGANGPCNRTSCTCQSTDSKGNCVAASGGIMQYCCAGNPALSCHPTANGELGYIERAGTPEIPQPAAPDPTFPKCGENAVLAAVFCEAATTSSTINGVAGLPGPGAGLFPIKWQLKTTGQADCP